MIMIKRTMSMIADRFGWEFIKEKIIYKQLSKDIGWWYTLGSLCLFLIILQVATGIILAGNYIPTIAGAYKSVQYIQNEMVLGWLIRGIHFWGATFMLIVVFIHMVRVYFHAGYKRPNEFTWMAGVFLIILTWAMALTGYILPWSNISYWAATILSACFSYIPVIGSWMANIVGGEQAGELTISRYASFHMLLLPILMAGFAVVHVILIQIHGEKGPPPSGEDVGTQPFFPYQLAKDVVVALVALVAIILFSRFIGVPTDKPAAPLAEVNAVPKPEWFILFGYEMLKMFKGKWIVVVLTVVPAVGFLLILFLPFYDRSEEQAYLKRPIAISAGAALLIVIGYLTLIAHISTPLPGKFFAPDRPMTVGELAGMALFERNVCYSCHSIKGTGMKNAPDLWKEGTKRDRDFLKKLLKDPDKVLGKGMMVKYYIDERDLEALISYIHSIDFISYDERLVKPVIFRGAYIVYRTGLPESTPGDREGQIAQLLRDNRHRLAARGLDAEISEEEIVNIAKYLATLKDGGTR